MRCTWLVVAALVCGCERDEPWRFHLRGSWPGDHSVLSQSCVFEVVGPDKRQHPGRFSMAYALDVIEASRGELARVRLTILKNERVRDGAEHEQLRPGTYTLVRAPGTDRMLVDGSATRVERDYLESMHASIDLEAANILNRREYRTGDTFAVPGRVLEPFGLTSASPPSPTVLTVAHADAATVALRTSYDSPGTSSEPDVHVAATIRVDRLGWDTALHGQLTSRGVPSGMFDCEHHVRSIFP